MPADGGWSSPVKGRRKKVHEDTHEARRGEDGPETGNTQGRAKVLSGRNGHMPALTGSSTSYGESQHALGELTKGTELHVANVPFDATLQDLQDLFSRFGNCKRIAMPRDRITNRSRGLAFVTYASSEDAERARLNTDGAYLNDRALRVELSHQGNGKWDCVGNSQSHNIKTLNPELRAAITMNKRLTERGVTGEQILQLFDKYGHEFDHVNLATTISRLARTRHVCPYNCEPRIPALLKAVHSKIGLFGPQELANTAWGIAKMDLAPQEELMADIVKHTVNKITKFNPQALANTVWAFATANHAAEKLFHIVADRICSMDAELSPQNVSNTAWSFASVGIVREDLFRVLALRTMGYAVGYNPQNLANTAWAFATCGIAAPDMFQTIAAEALVRVEDFNTQDLSNTAWAFATAQVRAPKMFRAIEKQAIQRMHEYDSQAVSNTAWAFAMAGMATPALFKVISVEARKRFEDFNTQDLANTLWAFASSGYHCPHIFDGIVAQMVARGHEYSPQQLAATAWSFATAANDSPVLFQILAREVEKRSHEFSSQAITNVVWAFATASMAAPRVFELVAAEFIRRPSEFNEQALTNLAWAFATAGEASSELFQALAAEVLTKAAAFDARQLSNLAWAYAAVGIVESTLLTDFIRRLLSIEMQGGLTERCASQLHMAMLFVAFEQPQLGLVDSVSVEQCERLRANFTANEVSPSRAQRNVSNALERLGWSHVFEYVTESGLSLDMAQPETKHAVEFDGPYHFMRPVQGEDTHFTNGTTRFKLRLLEADGWSVLRVPYYECNALKQNGTDLEDYLRQGCKRKFGVDLKSVQTVSKEKQEKQEKQQRHHKETGLDHLGANATGTPPTRMQEKQMPAVAASPRPAMKWNVVASAKTAKASPQAIVPPRGQGAANPGNGVGAKAGAGWGHAGGSMHGRR